MRLHLHRDLEHTKKSNGQIKGDRTTSFDRIP
jgi:hypothetical protein